MKKFKSIFFKICIVACMVLSIFATSVVNAAGTHSGSGGQRGASASSGTSGTTAVAGELVPENYSPKDGEIDSIVVEKYSSRFFNFLYMIAVIVTIIMLMYVGLKYITGSVSEKAEYKKNLVPIAIGALLVSFLATIIRIIFSIASTI